MRNKETVNGTVIKVTEEHIVLLLSNGSFKNVPRQGELPSLGDHYEYVEKKSLSFNKFTKFASVAALFVLSILIYSLSSEDLTEPSYIIALDINPSVEVFVDENNNVTELVGINDDGHEILEQIESEGSLKAVLDQLLSQLRNYGYIADGERAQITTSIVNLDEKKVTQKLDIEKTIADQFSKENVDSTIKSIDKDTYDQAKSLDLSVNQFEVYTQLKEQGIVKSVEEVRNKTIRELREIKEKSLNNRNSNRSDEVKDSNQKEKNKAQEAENNNRSNSSSQTPNEEADQPNNRAPQQNSEHDSKQAKERATQEKPNQAEQHESNQNKNPGSNHKPRNKKENNDGNESSNPTNTNDDVESDSSHEGEKEVETNEQEEEKEEDEPEEEDREEEREEDEPEEDTGEEREESNPQQEPVEDMDRDERDRKKQDHET